MTFLPLPVLLPLLLLPTLSLSRLTHNGLPTGQTLAPRAIDYLSPPLSSPLAPFHTLHDHACATPGVSHTVLRIHTTSPPHLARVVSVSQLSQLFASAAAPPLPAPPSPVLVLFHGGRSCEWSRAIWPIWLSVAQRYRTLCFVAIDAAADYMLNYNLMVLGFPTVMRVRADRPNETFRGNRTVENLVAWVNDVTGVAPMDGLVDERRWLGPPSGSLDLTGAHAADELNWPLVAANCVSVCNVLWLLWKAAAIVKRKVAGKTRDAQDDVVPEG